MGTTSSFFGGGGGSPLPEPEWLFQKSSYTYTFPYNGVVRVHVVGAGGSGGVQTSDYITTGGGAGGYSRKQFTVTSSTTATVTTGVGGKSVGSGVNDAEGITGGNTTFVLSSTTLTANGGVGGLRYPGPNAFAAGGTASGGDVNYQGGRSGKSYAQYNNQYRFATGGGAVNLFGFTTEAVGGGDITNACYKSATGGGGTGGKGGGIGCTANFHASGGGGASGPAKEIENGTNGEARTSAGGTGGAKLFLFNGSLLDGVGGRGLVVDLNTSTGRSEIPSFGTIGMGAGSGGMSQSNGGGGFGSDLQPPTAGLFGGGGGTVCDGRGGHGSHASLGGGGGGCVSASNTPRRESGAGGDGIVIIEYIERS